MIHRRDLYNTWAHQKRTSVQMLQNRARPPDFRAAVWPHVVALATKPENPMTKKAHVMLVHGAWADGSCTKRIKATVRSVPSSHAPFMAHPQEVVKIILEAVESA